MRQTKRYAGTERKTLPHAAQGILHLDLANGPICMIFDFFEQLPFSGNDLSQGSFEVRLVCGGVASETLIERWAVRGNLWGLASKH